MRRALRILAASCTLLTVAGAAAAEDARAWTWGTALGSPQLIAVTLERSADTPVRIQAHAGTIFFLASSLGVRLLVVSSGHRAAPYAFAGGGIFNIVEGDGGGALGSTGYGWGGAGIRFSTGALTWFAELGGMWGMDTSKGYESALPALALGVGFGGR